MTLRPLTTASAARAEADARRYAASRIMMAAKWLPVGTDLARIEDALAAAFEDGYKLAERRTAL